MKHEYKLSVVIAVQYAQGNIPEILEKLNPAGHPDVEFLFISTEADPATAEMVASIDTRYENTRVISGSVGSLIPHLWRDGIMVAQADIVALGTAHCIPVNDWVAQLLAAEMTSHPGIGGVIENDSASSARDWAVYLLRYISFAPPQKSRQVAEIAADNAVYRRADIMQQMDLLQKGFWEPSFHARFRKAGLTLALNPELRVIHRNLYSSRQFFVQRLSHGKAFGLARAREISVVKRLLLIALSPLLPVVFLRKIMAAVIHHGKYKSKLFLALPWLLLFLLAWGLGEAQGYLAAGRVTGQADNSNNG